MSTTEKYDLDLVDYGTTGWNSILSGALEDIDEYLHTRLRYQAGETLTAYVPVYLGTDGKLWKAQAAVLKLPCVGVTMDAGNADDYVRAVRVGPMVNPAWSWTPGSLLYVHTTAGQLTHTKPSAFSQEIGIAQSATEILVNIKDVSPVHYGADDAPTPTDYPDGILYFQYEE